MAVLGNAAFTLNTFVFFPPRRMRSPGPEEKAPPKQQPEPSSRSQKPRSVLDFVSAVFVEAGPLSLLFGGISLAIHWGGGLYWTLPGLLLTLATTLQVIWQIIASAHPLESN